MQMQMQIQTDTGAHDSSIGQHNSEESSHMFLTVDL